jgi:hypothetical protein
MLLLLGPLLLAPLPALATGWSDSDVEAAERYREAERERALRYRAAMADAPSERARPEVAARAEKSDPTGLSGSLEAAQRMVERWLSELARDLGTWTAWVDELRRAVAWWREEVMPQLHAIVDRVDRTLSGERGHEKPYASRSGVRGGSASEPSGVVRSTMPSRSSDWLAEERERLRREGLDSLVTRMP